MAIRYGRKNCHHEWAIRADGYEEGCAPIICIKKMGIPASLYNRLQFSMIIPDDYKARQKEQKLFDLIFSRKYNSTDNINQKWKNPYVKKLKTEKNKK